MDNTKNTPDDLNPEFIFSGTATDLLAKAVQGIINLKFLAHKELAARGLNASGEWVGFDKADEFLSQAYN